MRTLKVLILINSIRKLHELSIAFLISYLLSVPLETKTWSVMFFHFILLVSLEEMEEELL
jgi:hypothetical protein